MSKIFRVKNALKSSCLLVSIVSISSCEPESNAEKRSLNFDDFETIESMWLFLISKGVQSSVALDFVNEYWEKFKNDKISLGVILGRCGKDLSLKNLRDETYKKINEDIEISGFEKPAFCSTSEEILPEDMTFKIWHTTKKWKKKK